MISTSVKIRLSVSHASSCMASCHGAALVELRTQVQFRPKDHRYQLPVVYSGVNYLITLVGRIYLRVLPYLATATTKPNNTLSRCDVKMHQGSITTDFSYAFACPIQQFSSARGVSLGNTSWQRASYSPTRGIHH